MIELEAVTSRTIACTSGIKRSGNFGGIALQTFVIAIDATSSLDLSRQFRKQLEETFNLPVKYLFLTHTHSDHRNGLQAFKDVPLVASKNCIQNMPKKLSSTDFIINSFQKSTTIEDGLSTVEFHWFGGHTIGSSGAYFPDDRTLFSGDLIFHRFNFSIPFLTFYQNKSFDNMSKKTGNPEEYIVAFENILNMDIDVIVPGHGPIIKNPKEFIQQQLVFINSVKVATLEVLRNNESMEDICLNDLKLVQLAYVRCDEEGKKAQSWKKWLDKYLDDLKQAFYTYYMALNV